MKKIIPGYIKPEKDELFSSWLIRLSYEHKVKSHTFCKYYFNYNTIWNRDIDKMFPIEITSKLTLHTELKMCEIYNLFIISYRDEVFNIQNISNYTPGLLNLGINHRKRKGFGLLYCPGCLSKKIPYYKKEWRLFYSICCSVCKLDLIDHCPHCFSPIAFHRLESGYKSSILKYPLYICSECKSDLRIFTKSKKTSQYKYLSYQEYVNDTLNKGYNDITQYSFSYFFVLHLLTNLLLTSSKKWNRVKIAVENYYNTNFIPKQNLHSTLEGRKDALLYSYLVLSNWPKTFKNVFVNTNVNLSDFSKEVKYLPYWFEKVIKEIK